MANFFLCTESKKTNACTPILASPQSPYDMIEYKGCVGREWTRVCNADFWSVGLFCVQIEETMSGKLGWISGDEDNAWFDALDRAALNLIRQYAIMAVDLIE